MKLSNNFSPNSIYSRMLCLIKHFLILLFIAISISCFSQFDQQHIHLSVTNGLSQNDVNCIYQDKQAYVWIGTAGGLNRFDGYKFDTYYHNLTDSTSLAWNTVYDITEDKCGQLWIATQNGLSKYNRATNNFTNYKIYNSNLRHSYISRFAKDFEGNIWVANGGKLNHIDCSITTQIVKIDSISGIDNLRLYSGLTLDKNGNIWVGSILHGVFFYDINTKSVKRFSLNNNYNLKVLSDSVTDIFCDSHNNLWVSYTKGGLTKYSITNDTSIHFMNIKSRVNRIYEDNSGKLYLATDGDGSYIFNNDSFIQYNSTNSDLFNDKITAIFEDYQNLLWVGYRHGGIGIFEKNKNPIYTLQYGVEKDLPYNMVSDIIVDSQNRVWIANDRGGILVKSDNKLTNLSNIYKDLSYTMLCIFEDADNEHFWMGTYDNGVVKYNTENNEIVNYKNILDDSTSIAGNDIRSISQDKYGNMWFAIHGMGFSKYDKTEERFYNFNFQDTSSFITHGQWSYVVLCVDDNVWVGSTIGLYKYNQKTGKGKFYRNTISNKNSISDNSAVSLLLDSKKRLWVGTHYGLNMFNAKDETFISYKMNDGLIDNGINSIIEDNKGNIWLGTGKGISKIELPQNKIVNFNSKDGLQGNEFSKNAVFKSNDGYLYFGGSNGYSKFKPDDLKINTIPPKTIISKIFISNKLIDINTPHSPLSKHISETDTIYLNHNQNILSFEFTGFSFINPENNEYSYMLEGLDTDWNYSGSARTVNYSNLNHGKYVLKVKAANSDGVWNNEYSNLVIIIKAPIWLRWYAYPIYFILIILVLYFFKKYSVISATKKSELLLKYLEQEKAKTINQAKIRFFTDISHEIRTPLTLIIDPINRLVENWEGNEKVKQQLKLIQNSSNKMLRLVNQLLDLRKLETGNEILQCMEGDIVEYISNIANNFMDYAIQKNIRLDVLKDDIKIQCFFDVDKIDKIVSNLISNALKFTPSSGYVIVSVSFNNTSSNNYPEGFVLITVEDSGIGIPSNKINSVFERFKQINSLKYKNIQGTGIGLSLTKHLVDLHKGELFVKSEMDKGSIFSVKLPFGRSHLSDAEIIENIFEPQILQNNEKTLDIKYPVVKSKDQHILLVEDDQDVLRYFADILIEEYNIITALTGKVGYEMAINNVPDLIISDVQMPDLDGNEMTKMLKTNSITSHIPIILLSARNLNEQKLESLAYGADEYITKPVDTYLLKIKIRNLLNTIQNQNIRIKQQLASQINLPINDANQDLLFIKKVQTLIEQQISNSDISVSDIANLMNMSRTQLFRKFKAILNQNPKDFIQSIRLQYAKKLLATSDISIKEITYQTGFSDQRYFSRIFSKEFGESPSAWRVNAKK